MSDPARDGYECHGPMYPIIVRGADCEVLGLICACCGITRNMVRDDPELRQTVDRALYESALAVAKKAVSAPRLDKPLIIT